ncbi:MAG: PD40 domain-containing protein, partial [Chitinivibrionia bacterium]|nr:PD40 domain-containing protein [Chitinivibrionia bacterium]
MSKRVFFAVLSFLAIACLDARAYNNTSLRWRTISTEHFEVHYHQGEEWTAAQVAHVAEEVHPFLAAVYHYEPKGKVHFVIKDTDDYANGATYYYDNKIEIWATNLEFGFRGTAKWIQNVVIHEYAHMISLQVGFKFTRRVPALYFQLIDFEKEKRPDVLTGYPSNIASYPLAGSVTPSWFAEGVAQFQSPLKQYDCWDTHRDMILRCAVLEDKMLTYDEMGFFGHTSMGNEQVYDHGFGLVNYIVERYGAESLRGALQAMRSPVRVSFNGALRKSTGHTGNELYGEWKAWMRERYARQAAAIRERLQEGRVLSRDGFMTVSPAWSPDGRSIALLSNKGSDFSGTALYTIGRNGSDMKRLKGGVDSRAVFEPGGGALVYSRKDKVDRYGSEQNDLYRYETASKKETRLTKGLRASDPAVSPDGTNIACVLNRDGTHRLALMDAGGGNVRVIYESEPGIQIYSPQFSSDGSRILMGIFEGVNRNIAMIGGDGGDFHYILATAHDERDARWIPGGGGIVFSSDRTGVFNIYALDFETNGIRQLTNVIGGAFMPDISPVDGALVYSGYTAGGYGVEILEDPRPVFPPLSIAEYGERSGEHEVACGFLKTPGGRGGGAPHAEVGALQQAAGRDTAFAAIPLRTGAAEPNDGERSAGADESPYKREFTSFQFYPRFILYDRTPRFGLLLAGNEILDRQSFILGASIG